MTNHDELLARLDSVSEAFTNNWLAKDAAAAIRSLQDHLEAERKAREEVEKEPAATQVKQSDRATNTDACVTPVCPASAAAHSGYWWCSKCKEELSWHHVTYEENCEYCGNQVVWIAAAQEHPDRTVSASPVRAGNPPAPSAAHFGNTGHGHVWERPDGVKARCGGPMMCKVCAIDKARFDAAATKQEVPKIPGTDEAWDERRLGADERYVKVAQEAPTDFPAVPAEFARQLERENAALRLLKDQLEAERKAREEAEKELGG